MHTNRIFHDIFQPFNADAQPCLPVDVASCFHLQHLGPVYHHSFNLKQQLDELNPEMKKIHYLSNIFQHSWPGFQAFTKKNTSQQLKTSVKPSALRKTTVTFSQPEHSWLQGDPFFFGFGLFSRATRWAPTSYKWSHNS